MGGAEQIIEVMGQLKDVRSKAEAKLITEQAVMEQSSVLRVTGGNQDMIRCSEPVAV